MGIKSPVPLECKEQEEIFRWRDYKANFHPELWLLQGSLNGIRLTIGQAVKAKKQGLNKGFPDISLPVPRKGFHGLFIELKRIKGGSVSREQKEILGNLSREGNFAIVCKGAREAITAIEDYLGIN